jgi:transposase
MKNNDKPSKAQRRARRKRVLHKHMEVVNLYSAGIDIGSEKHYVAVPEGLDDDPVRCFSCFTADLQRMADWLVEIGITTVVMESTGVYWIPAFEILAERGLEVLLVNARHVKNVSGRKSDVQDCQWLQQLHTFGLLAGAFRPPEQVCALRSYTRQRETLVHSASAHIQHMQKALRQMNLLLDNVVSDVTGKTGMDIIRAIVSGERDPDRLAAYRDPRCKQSQATIAESLRGHYRAEHLFTLRQSLAAYDFYQTQIEQCDGEIEQQLADFDSHCEAGELKPLGQTGQPRKTRSSPKGAVREQLYRITAVDLTQIHGLDENSVLKIISETGTDMTCWRTHKHFTSWLSLSPNNTVSGGKVLKSKTKSSANRAATAFRIAAMSISRSDSALGAFYRRLSFRVGKAKAITATARKLAVIFYMMIKHKTEYVDQGQAYYEQQYRERTLNYLKKKAQTLGFDLTPIDLENNELSIA